MTPAVSPPEHSRATSPAKAAIDAQRDLERLRDLGCAIYPLRRWAGGDGRLEQSAQAQVAVGGATLRDAVGGAPDHRWGAAVGEDPWSDPRTYP